MKGNYHADEPLKRIRLKALEMAQHHIGKSYPERADRQIAAEELLGFRVFTGAQITEWLELPEWALDGRVEGRITAWGQSALSKEQIPHAIELAKAGLTADKPKTLIHHGYHQLDMSFNSIGGLLGIHKNVVRRIVKRIDGEPWT